MAHHESTINEQRDSAPSFPSLHCSELTPPCWYQPNPAGTPDKGQTKLSLRRAAPVSRPGVPLIEGACTTGDKRKGRSAAELC